MNGSRPFTIIGISSAQNDLQVTPRAIKAASKQVVANLSPVTKTSCQPR